MCRLNGSVYGLRTGFPHLMWVHLIIVKRMLARYLMAKFLTLFNVVASAASIAGLYIALGMAHANVFLVVIFTVALLVSAYVLLVPGNPLEKNVAAKIWIFEDPSSGERLMVQEGLFEIHGRGTATAQFYQPFGEPPEVQVLNAGRNGKGRPRVSRVSTLHAEFERISYEIGSASRFKWIARGKPLKLVEGT